MGIIDFSIIGIIVLSGLFACYRGLVRELLGLVSWILAVFCAFYGLVLFRPLFQKMITNPLVADTVAVVVIALVVLVVCTIINAKINSKLRKSVLSGLDRILGCIFGVLRGAIFVFAIYFLCVFAMPSKTMEKYSNHNILPNYLSMAVPYIEKALPDSFVEGLKNNTQSTDNPITSENVKVKEKPQLDTEKQEAPYDEKDLKSMDNLLEELE